METNHLNRYYGENFEIWCEKVDAIVQPDQRFFDNQCMACPFFNGHLQGEGIECLYEDPITDSPVISVRNPYEYERYRKSENQKIAHVVEAKKGKKRGA